MAVFFLYVSSNAQQPVLRNLSIAWGICFLHVRVWDLQAHLQIPERGSRGRVVVVGLPKEACPTLDDCRQSASFTGLFTRREMNKSRIVQRGFRFLPNYFSQI